MNAIVCELCGSNNIVKQDGVYVCQHCGTKYSPEEAKKLIVEGSVDVSGSTVKVDTTDDLKKLYQAARNAREAADTESAIRHYESISAKDPDSWEAIFYPVVLRINNIKNGEIETAAGRIVACLPKVFNLIKTKVEAEADQKVAVGEVYSQCSSAAKTLTNASHAFYKTVTNVTKYSVSVASASMEADALSADKSRCATIARIMAMCGDGIESLFDTNDPYYKKHALASWRAVLAFHQEYANFHGNHFLVNTDLFDSEYLHTVSTKINKYDPSAEIISEKKTGGCYVATAVYGSYDCPQVWTLRRYRDNTLAGTWYGRAFIRTYYAISPTLVKWFGKTEWFKNLWKPKLDRMVQRLNSEGVADTPYNDRAW